MGTYNTVANQNIQAFLAKPKTSSLGPKLCENFRSVFQISESCASGKVYILASRAIRKKPPNLRVLQQHSTIPKTFNTFSTNPSFKNSANRRPSKRRSPKHWGEAMHMMHRGSNAMLQGRKRLARQSTRSIMSSANAIQRSSMRYET